MIGTGVTKHNFIMELRSKERRPPKILANYDYDISYLKKPQENFPAVCKHCGKTVRASMNVTTNLVNHIKKHIGIAQNRNKNTQNDSKTSNETIIPNKSELSEPNHTENMIVSTLIKCLIPLDVLGMQPFQNMLNTLNPSISQISPSKINSNIIPHLYTETKNHILNTLSQIDSLSILLDVKLIDQVNYMSVYCYFLDLDWKFQSILLGVQKYLTYDSIEDHLDEILKDFDLRDKVYSICLNENSEYFENETSILDILDINCVKLESCSSILDLVVSNSLNELALIEKFKNYILTFLNTSFIDENLEEFKLKLSLNLNKWTNLLEVIDIFLTIPDDLIEILNSNQDEFKICTSEKLILKKILNLFQPFGDLSTDLIKDYGSVSLMYPAYKGLLTHLNCFKENNKDLEIVLKNLEVNLREKLGFVESTSVFSIGALLNPNFGFNWIDDNEMGLYEQILRNDFSKMVNGGLHNDSSIAKPSLPRKSYLCFSRSSVNESERMNELNNYFSFVKSFVYDENFNLFDYWRTNEKTSPYLAKFAKKILTTPVGLVVKEDCENNLGMNMLRTSTSMRNDSNFSTIMFIKSNLK
ncbi:unnamed protein product [Brachionus calyciflorus]|uniref:BED-type domain-containing protein n=1 Tax=Brachionus calyciflorus TaxID=104777 RepID=A0A814JW46_9BILA|nr:unnamed protein product [Brachionus calyciflorus]